MSSSYTLYNCPMFFNLLTNFCLLLNVFRSLTIKAVIDVRAFYANFHLFISLISFSCLLVGSVPFSSVTQSCPTLCDPMDCSTPGLPVHLKLMSIKSVMSSNHLILCHPFLCPPSIFPSIQVFSNESALGIRWQMYWSFSFNISPSSEYPSPLGWTG